MKNIIQFNDTSTGDVNEWYWDFGDGLDSTLHWDIVLVPSNINPITDIFATVLSWLDTYTNESGRFDFTFLEAVEDENWESIYYGTSFGTGPWPKSAYQVTIFRNESPFNFLAGGGSIYNHAAVTYNGTETAQVMGLRILHEMLHSMEIDSDQMVGTNVVAFGAYLTEIGDPHAEAFNANPSAYEHNPDVQQVYYKWLLDNFYKDADLYRGTNISHSYDQNPLHKYLATGIYTVTLYSSNQYQYNTYRTNIVVDSIIYEHPPIVNFTPSYLNIITNSSYNVTFNNLTYPLDDCTYLWNFGDSTASTSINPTHNYALGIYDVTLTATNAYGSSSLTYYDCIKIHNKARTFYEHTITADFATKFDCQIFNETATSTDNIIHAKVFDENCEIIQREVPDKPGIDEFGIQYLYSKFNEFGHSIMTTINEWGHKIIRSASTVDKTGLKKIRMKRFDETIYVEDRYEFENDYAT